MTGSTGYQGTSNLNQQMPPALGQQRQVADNGPYTPPDDVGGGGYSSASAAPPRALVKATRTCRRHRLLSECSFSSQDLPVIGNTSSNGNSAMSAQPAQQNLTPISSMPKPLAAVPNLTVVQPGTYTHVIKSGESLYTIAKHYGVTAQAIMQATGIAAPDKIFVGQRVVIPGRPDLLAAMDDVKLPTDAAKVAAEAEKLPIDSSKPDPCLG